jgi:hypothetical protein
MPMPAKNWHLTGCLEREVRQKLELFKYKNGQPGTNHDCLVQWGTSLEKTAQMVQCRGNRNSVVVERDKLRPDDLEWRNNDDGVTAGKELLRP